MSKYTYPTLENNAKIGITESVLSEKAFNKKYNLTNLNSHKATKKSWKDISHNDIILK